MAKEKRRKVIELESERERKTEIEMKASNNLLNTLSSVVTVIHTIVFDVPDATKCNAKTSQSIDTT